MLNNLTKVQSKLITSILITAVIAGSAGFLTGRSKIAVPNTLSQSQAPDKNPLFLEQRAVFQGKITKFDATKITLENKQGVKGEYSVAAHVSIYKEMDSAKVSTPSSDLKQIELNKEAVVVLKIGNDGTYKVSNVNYLAPQGTQQSGSAPVSTNKK